jgi:hypothetical protein
MVRDRASHRIRGWQEVPCLEKRRREPDAVGDLLRALFGNVTRDVVVRVGGCQRADVGSSEDLPLARRRGALLLRTADQLAHGVFERIGLAQPRGDRFRFARERRVGGRLAGSNRKSKKTRGGGAVPPLGGQGPR